VARLVAESNLLYDDGIEKGNKIAALEKANREKDERIAILVANEIENNAAALGLYQQIVVLTAERDRLLEDINQLTLNGKMLGDELLAYRDWFKRHDESIEVHNGYVSIQTALSIQAELISNKKVSVNMRDIVKRYPDFFEAIKRRKMTLKGLEETALSGKKEIDSDPDGILAMTEEYGEREAEDDTRK
jgi:hypothetical protein